MLYAFIGYDKPDSVSLRLASRPEHLDFLNNMADRLKAAGPHIDEATGDPVGSIVIVEGESQDSVVELFAQDPYAKAGLFERTDVLPYKLVLGSFAE